MSKPAPLSLANKRILVIDDHRNIRLSLKLILEGEGAKLEEAETIAGAKKILTPQMQTSPVMPSAKRVGHLSDKFAYDLVLMDIRLPDGNGVDLLRYMHENFPETTSRFIMISGEGSLQEAVNATELGAFDYIEKPFPPERVLTSVRRCLDFASILHRNEILQTQLSSENEIVGNHSSIKELKALITKVAPTSSRVLILGETGTGKELVARAIHRLSERSAKPLIKVNCAAIPQSLMESELFGHEKGAFTGAINTRRGLFEQAHGGTIFLDEIGELPASAQAKLLRVLETGEVVRLGSEKVSHVDVRVISATHRDIPEMISSNEFREDLYYRLNVFSISIPPLRERGMDITLLAQRFLEATIKENSLGQRYFSETSLGQLQAYSWPGNVRELKNLVERMAILASDDCMDDVSEFLTKKIQKDTPATEEAKAEEADHFRFEAGVLGWEEFHGAIDRQYLLFVLQRTKGNISEASRLLHLERAYIYRLMKKLGLQRDVVLSE